MFLFFLICTVKCYSTSVNLKIVGDNWVQVCQENGVEVPCAIPMAPVPITNSVAYDDEGAMASPKEKKGRFFLWMIIDYFGGIVLCVVEKLYKMLLQLLRMNLI